MMTCLARGHRRGLTVADAGLQTPCEPDLDREVSAPTTTAAVPAIRRGDVFTKGCVAR